MSLAAQPASVTGGWATAGIPRREAPPRTLPPHPLRGVPDHLVAALSPRHPDYLHFSRPAGHRNTNPSENPRKGAARDSGGTSARRTATSTGPGRGPVGFAMTLRQACPRDKPRAQLAFKDSMIRGILQFTLRIAFRCVLHRCKSQDIRC